MKTNYNPERRTWRGKSYKKGGTRVKVLRDETETTSQDVVFPIGARVLVDGRDEAIVKAAFPKGAAMFLFPHYKLDFIDGDKNVAVSMKRVGVELIDLELKA